MPIEVVEEPVHDPALPGLVLERSADDTPGQVGGQRADFGTQRGQRLLALRVDLRVRGLGETPRLGLRLLAHLGDDLGALFPGLLAEAGGFVPGLGELLAVLLEGPLGFGLGLLGVLQAPSICSVCSRSITRALREQQLAEHAKDDEERDRPDDELWPGRTR